MKWKIVLTQPIHEKGVSLLKKYADVEIKNFEANTPEDIIAESVRGADAIITRTPKITRRVIEEAGSQLKVIGRHGAGYDNVDVKAATERGIPVVYTPYAPAESVAEHVIGFMLCLSKGISIADRMLREDPDRGWKLRYRFAGTTLRGKTLGIIGLGRIGSIVAKYAKGFEMNLIYYDLLRKRELEAILNIKFTSLSELLKESDFVVISVPLTKKTEKMIGERELNSMKRNAFLINVSRGEVVDERALIKCLRERRIRGAALDVYEEEPISRENPLLKLENTVLTPHMAAHTEEFFIEAAVTVAEEVLRVLRGGRPNYLANPEVFRRN